MMTSASGNAGNSRPARMSTSPLTIISRLEALLGRAAQFDHRPFHAADIKETWADIAKAGRLLGWQPEVPLDEGLRRSVEWYRANRDWLRTLRF